MADLALEAPGPEVTPLESAVGVVHPVGAHTHNQGLQVVGCETVEGEGDGHGQSSSVGRERVITGVPSCQRASVHNRSDRRFR